MCSEATRKGRALVFCGERAQLCACVFVRLGGRLGGGGECVCMVGEKRGLVRVRVGL